MEQVGVRAADIYPRGEARTWIEMYEPKYVEAASPAQSNVAGPVDNCFCPVSRRVGLCWVWGRRHGALLVLLIISNYHPTFDCRSYAGLPARLVCTPPMGAARQMDVQVAADSGHVEADPL